MMQVRFREWLEATMAGFVYLLNKLGRGLVAKKAGTVFLAVVLSVGLVSNYVHPLKDNWVAVEAVYSDKAISIENYRWTDVELLEPPTLFHAIEFDGLDEGTLFLRVSLASRISALLTGSKVYSGNVFCGHHFANVYQFRLEKLPKNFIRLTVTLKGNIVHDVWFRQFDPDATDTLGQLQAAVLSSP